MPSRGHAISRWILGTFFAVAGANHFRDPAAYLAMLPPWLPAQGPLVDVSGAAEILGGLSILVPRSRTVAAWGLIALLVAVFPANVNMAVRSTDAPDPHIATWLLWARLPLQAVLIAWVWWSALPDRRGPGSA